MIDWKHKNKLLFLPNVFNLSSVCRHVKRGRHVHYGNAVVQAPLSAASVISASCISVAVVHI